MCGIIMKISKGKESVSRDILHQFEDQRSRGTQGFGSVFLDNKGKMTLKRATSEVLATVDLSLNNSNSIIFHHRAPSSSRNKISQTHPIEIKNGSLKHDYLFMHNGVISNSDERKKTHEDNLGFVYSTSVIDSDYYNREEEMYNDTESLGIDVARFIEGQTKAIKAVGSAAFFMIQSDKKTGIVQKIFFGRNDRNPLNLAKTRGELMLSSEGKGEEVKEDMLYSFDPKSDNMKLSKKKMVIPGFKPVVTIATSTEKDKTTNGTPYQSRGGPILVDDDHDIGYKTDTFDSFSRDPLEVELEEITEEYEDEASRALSEFFDELKATGHEMFKVDVTKTLKEIAQYMITGQEEAQKAWSEFMAKEMDDELNGKLEEEVEVKVPEKLNSK